MLRHIGVDFNIIDTSDLNTTIPRDDPARYWPLGHATFIEENDFDKKIVDLVKNKNFPILGICLGMQLYVNAEEGDVEGLGLIDADVVRFASDKDTA